jgi:5-methylcytosine-specific restriction endonuclease McrA
MSELSRRVLLLNADFQPLGTVGVARAILLKYREEKPVQILENVEGRFLNAATDNPVPIPSVMRLMDYVTVKKNRAPSGKKRDRIYARDFFTCQYCSISVGQVHPRTKKALTKKQLTLDHITPKSKNGSSAVTNLVTSCEWCNRKKANRTPDEARMPLRTEVKNISLEGTEDLQLCSYVEHNPNWLFWLKAKDGFEETYERYQAMKMAA